MNDSQASDSSLDGDDSTVSSKSNRNRLGNAGDGGESSQQVADFSDMPSLASYRGDEASLASTLWTDCDQSLPSLSSYRTRDMSVASGSTRRNNRHESSTGSRRSNNGDDDSDGSGTERTRGNISTSGRQQAPIDSIEENAKPFSSSSREEEPPAEAAAANTAALAKGGDSMPRLPTRRSMDDSVRSGSIKSDSDSDSQSDMTDDSPDVSIDTDEENDDETEPAHGPSHVVVPPTRQLSPQSPKSPVRVNGVLPDISNPPLRVEDGTGEISEKEKSSKAIDEAISPEEPLPPAIIATPPATGNFSKSAKKKSPKRSPKKSPRKKKIKDKDGTNKDGTNSQSDLPSPGLVEEKQQKKWRKKRTTQETSKKTPDRSASGSDTMRFFGKKNQSDKSHGVRRANSEMASVLDSIKPPEEEKKRGILKRFSSSLKQMVRPSKTLSGTLGNVTKIPSGGKKRSKLKKLSTRPDK